MASGEPDPQIIQERILFGGLTVLFSVLGPLIPAFLYIAPVPLGVITYRQGMRVGTRTAVIAAVITGLFIHVIGLMMVLLLLALGLALGGGLREGLRPAQVLTLGSIVSLIVFTTLLFTVQSLLGMNLIDELFTQWEVAFGADFEPFLQQIRTVLPGMMVTSSIAIAFLNMMGIHKVITARGISSPWFRPFRLWRFPMGLALALVASQALGYIALPALLQAIVSNVALVLFYVFVVAGISVCAFYGREWGLHTGVVVLFAVFALFVPLGQNLMVLLGLIDAGFNLRRHREE